MAKRWTATEIWAEDWFLEMPVEYKLFWYYMLSSCNHAGIFKVNLRSFCGLNGVKVTSTNVLKYFNSGKVRVRELDSAAWFVEDFFIYQYGETLNLNNRVHKSIADQWVKFKIDLGSIRGLKEVKHGLIVTDTDIDKDKKRETGVGMEGDRSNNLNGLAVTDAEKVILENKIEFERICMTTGIGPEHAKTSLRKFHLHLQEKEQYPKGRKAVFAGFEKWLMNEKYSTNGKGSKTYQSGNSGKPAANIHSDRGTKKL